MRPAILLVIAACTPRSGTDHPQVPAAGVSIAMYQGADHAYAVVDDRRWVAVTGKSLVLDHVDPGAALPSLVIEPLAGGVLTVGRCVRERLEPPPAWGELRPRPHLEEDGERDPEPEVSTAIPSEVRCDVAGDAGRHLIRILYVTSSLAYRVQHDVTMTIADRATITTRFAIATPHWGGGRAEVILFDGQPGTDHAPREMARGSIALDGSTGVLLAPVREGAAHLRRVFDGAMRNGAAADSDATWARDSVQAVWVWLEVEGVVLPAGPLHAHVELPGEPIRDVEVPAAGRERTKDALRFPLWIDDQLRGMRRRVVGSADGASLVDRFVLSVINTGDAPREVWIEERLRHARRRELKHAWPGTPTLAGDVARIKVVVAAGAVERTGYAIEYGF
jgi:hypothetical protein